MKKHQNHQFTSISNVCNFKSFSFLNESSYEDGLELQGIVHRIIFKRFCASNETTLAIIAYLFI